MNTAFAGLGSNLGDRQFHLHQALSRLGSLAQTHLVAVSSIYETDSVGDPTEPRYLNAVVQVETSLLPGPLLAALQDIEVDLGRPRRGRSGPRSMDLDLLLYEDQLLDGPVLRVPHPRMIIRAFVMIPLAEIAPRHRHPVLGETMAELARRAPGRAGVRWAGRFQEVEA